MGAKIINIFQMTTLGILLSALICLQAAGQDGGRTGELAGRQTCKLAGGRTCERADGQACAGGTAAVQSEENPGRYAVVNLSVNFLREEPDYTAELGTQALMGTVVEIKGEESYWRKVVTPEPYTAWCTEKGLVEMTAEEIDDYLAAPKYICTAWHSTLFSSPSEKSPKICDLVQGDVLRQVFRSGRRGNSGNYRNSEKYGNAYLGSGKKEKSVVRKTGDSGAGRRAESKGGFLKAMLPDGACGYVKASDVEDYSQWKATRMFSGENVVREAMKYVGVPYLWGGASPNGVDCSGLALLAYRFCGVALPRNASQQARLGDMLKVRNGEDFVLDSLQAGDLLFFGSWREDGSAKVTHVGIYIGDGRFIHSSQVVRVNSLLASREDYYENSHRLLFAKRIIK